MRIAIAIFVIVGIFLEPCWAATGGNAASAIDDDSFISNRGLATAAVNGGNDSSHADPHGLPDADRGTATATTTVGCTNGDGTYAAAAHGNSAGHRVGRLQRHDLDERHSRRGP